MTPQGRERRAEILRAARKVFEDHGFLDTRVADMVAAAGVAQGTFYTYFDSKEAVYIEAFRPNAVMIGLIQQVGTLTPEMRRLRLTARESFVDRAARAIRRMQDAGVADPGGDPTMLAEVLGAMVDETFYMWFFLGKDFDSDAVVDTLTTVWTRAVGVKGS
jgi:AcrR family transcriptional regulator